jgi:hypothetical protein
MIFSIYIIIYNKSLVLYFHAINGYHIFFDCSMRFEMLALASYSERKLIQSDHCFSDQKITKSHFALKKETVIFDVIRLNHTHPILSENKTKTMKQTILCLIFLFSAYFNSQAQHVNVRLNFPSNISKRPSGRPPFRDACWIEPEWNWNGSRYDYVPGYWSKPHRNHLKWRAGHWKRTRRGFVWIPGRWRK